MIDTIAVSLNKEHFNNNTIPFDLIKIKMTPESIIKQYNNNDELIRITGMISNFHIKLTHNYIKLNGSLCKFFKGNNIETLTRSEIREAIKKLSTQLEVPISRGLLCRVDIGRNFEMKNDVVDYFDLLKETPTYRRNHATKSELKFMRDKLTLSFYDKGKETVDKSETFSRRSQSLKNKSNLLRYELKLEAKVAQHLKYKKTKVALLLCPSFLDKLNDKWYEHYCKLIKEKRIAFDERVTSVKELRYQIEIAGIDNFGGEAIIRKYIDDLSKKNQWSYKQKHDAKKMIDKIMTNPSLYKEEDKIIELNQAIEKAYLIDNRY